MLSEPTKSDLYKLVADIAGQGKSIFLYASDLNEMLHICDRILIMYEGKIVDELENKDLDEETLMSKCIQHGGPGGCEDAEIPVEEASRD